MRTHLLIACTIIQLLVTLRLSYNGAGAIEFKMTNLVCDSYNKSWVRIDTCRLRALSRNKTCMYANAFFLHPANTINARFELYQKANGYKPWLINTSIDVCRFMKKPFNPVAILISKLLLEFTNFNHTCPYVGMQIVDGFYPRWNYLPHTMPTGEYKLEISWSFDRRLQFVTNVYFVFKEDLKAKN